MLVLTSASANAANPSTLFTYAYCHLVSLVIRNLPCGGAPCNAQMLANCTESSSRFQGGSCLVQPVKQGTQLVMLSTSRLHLRVGGTTCTTSRRSDEGEELNTIDSLTISLLSFVVYHEFSRDKPQEIAKGARNVLLELERLLSKYQELGPDTNSGGSAPTRAKRACKRPRLDPKDINV